MDNISNDALMYYNGFDTTQNFFSDDLTTRSTSRIVGSVVTKNVSLDDISPTLGSLNIDPYLPDLGSSTPPSVGLMDTVDMGWDTQGNISYEWPPCSETNEGYTTNPNPQNGSFASVPVSEEWLNYSSMSQNSDTSEDSGIDVKFKSQPEFLDVKPVVKTSRGGRRRPSNPRYNNDPSYAEHRQKNNEAVKKSRAKAKQREEEANKKATEMQRQIGQLTRRIHQLERDLDMEQRKNKHLTNLVQMMRDENQIQPIQSSLDGRVPGM